MAKTKGPLLSAEARGKFGNSILFQKDKGLSTARVMFKPKNRKTIFQQANRSNIMTGVNAWQGLSDAYKIIWEEARKNSNLKMSGYNFFLSQYNTQRTAGYDPNLLPGPPPPKPSPILTDLVSWWKFDEAAGSIANDSIGTNTGTINGATHVIGKINLALSFNGVNNYVSALDSVSLRPANLTLEAWVNPLIAGAGNGHIIGKNYNNIRSSFGIQLISNYRLWAMILDTNGNTEYGINSIASLGLGVWTHVVFTYNGSKIKLYLNTILKNSLNTSTNIAYSSWALDIGRNYYSPSWIYLKDTVIDEVRIYKRALSQEEILNNYNLK